MSSLDTTTSDIKPDEAAERNAVVKEFWDTYADSGITLATELLTKRTQDPRITQMLMPYIAAEGAERNVDPIAFLTEMRDAQEKANAVRTTDDGGGLHPGGTDEVDGPENEDGSTPARDADGESGVQGEAS